MSPMAQYLALAAIFSAGVFGYLMRAFDWLHAIPGDLVDARFNSIILEHLYLWVSGHAPSLWSPGYFYPFEGALAFSDNHFGSGGVYVASRWLGLSREQAFQAWFIAGSTLNFWATYYALRKLGFSIVSAGAGAFVYAFGLPSLAKEGHAQLTYRFAVPLAFASFYRALSLKSVSDLALAAFWCAFQFFCSIYLGIFLVYLLAGTFLACWIAYGRTLAQGWLVAWSRAQWTTRALSLALLVASAAALAWLLWMYQTIAAHYGLVRSSKEVFSMLPRPGSYLLADWSGLSSWVGRLVTQVPMRHEQQMFFGLGAWILALAGLSQIRARLHAAALVQVAAIALVFLVGLTLLIGNVTAYRAILHLPGVGSVRAVSRIVLVMLLPGAILVAAAFDWAAKSASVRGWRRLPLMLILMTLLTAETAAYRSNNTPVSAWLGRQAALRAMLPPGLAADRILFLTERRGTQNPDLDEVDGIILAQDRRLTTLNGYSGNLPPGHLRAESCLHFRNRLDSYFAFKPDPGRQIEELAARVVVISPDPCPAEPWMPGTTAVDRALATHVDVSILSATITSGRLLAEVSVTNRSPSAFVTASTKGPVRLSWRFVRLDAAGNAVDEPEFDVRKELNFRLAEGQTKIEPLDLGLPGPGRYRFDVTLVQDGVNWFHALGMPIAHKRIDVP
jgi:hypothetical protein